jgi:hypothetical protein
MKCKLNLWDTYYYPFQELLSCFLSINVQTEIHRTVILPVALCGCEMWFLTLRKEHRPRVFETRVVKYLGLSGSYRTLEKTV